MKPIINQLKKETESILSDLGLNPKPKSMIGLDIGTGYFRAARVKEGVKEVPLRDTLVKRLPELKDLSSQMHIGADEQISINFSGEGLAIKRVRLPFMPVEEIKEALKWELKEQLAHTVIDNSEIKYSILGERQDEDGSKKIDLIAVVYDEKIVKEKVRELKTLGFNVQGVIPSEFALASYANHQNLISSDETLAIVNIGESATIIAIIENKKVSFTRHVAMGGDTITEAMTGTLVSDKGKIELSKEEAEKIKREHGISEDVRILSMMRPVLERLVTQIKRSMEYCEHQFETKPVKKIILAGGGARLKGLKEYLSKEMEIEISIVLPEVSEAVGLGLASDSDINMLPEEFKEERGKAIKKISIRMSSIVFGLIFLFSYGLLAARSINLKKELQIYRSHLETVQDIKTIKDEMFILGSAANTISSGSIASGDIMKELSNIVVSFMRLDNLVIKVTEPNVELSGIVLKQGQLSEFMSLLEASPMFEKVKLVVSKKNEDYSTGALDFEIVCNLTR